MAAKDPYTREWITRNAVDIIARYPAGELTVRALHYQLVGRGMTNSQRHYKRVVAAMENARWDGVVNFGTFIDRERDVIGETRADVTDIADSITTGIRQVGLWMSVYRKNRWENQPVYPELFIEKKALLATFEKVAKENDVALAAVKGYPSLTFLYETAQRMEERQREGKECVILYFGDYDPSGEDIPRCIGENLGRMGVDVEVRRISLFEHQVREWRLPPAPAKETDSRTAAWDGIGQVELDAVPNDRLKQMARDAIADCFDDDLYEELERVEEEERERYQRELKAYVNSL